jgi:RNA polymerase sigma-70 factor (ECF subfamily)
VNFEALAIAHKDAVYRQLIRSCGNAADAEDVLVEALLKAYRHLDQLQDPGAFRAWLAQIGRRVCWALKKREALAPLMQLSALQEQGREPADSAIAPDLQASRAELRALLDDAVARLDPPYREVFILRDIEELSGEAVAQQLGITLAAQKSRLHRARQQVREHLDAMLAAP